MSSDDQYLLHVESLGKRFGGVTALSGYHVSIQPGELVGLIGPNGAGKTTVFNLLSGVLRPNKGRISFNGRNLAGRRPHQCARAGIARTFQNIRLFGDLSVKDNVKVAFHMELGRGFWSTLFSFPGYRRSERKMEDQCLEYLDLLNLTECRNERAGNLPYGLQRRVEICRALAASPRLLLLDEPAAGMNIGETEELVGVIRRIHGEYDLTIFLVEHDMNLIMKICQSIQVLERGMVLMQGAPEEVRRDERVIEAYLGKPKK